MNTDITNMVYDLAQKTDWIEHIITCVSVFFGAFLAYRLNLKLELRKAKRLIRKDFCILSSQIWWNFDEMKDYKKNILDKIKIAYENKNIEAISTIIRGPMVSFNVDMDKYIFLNDCNRCFLPELMIVQSVYEDLKLSWAHYTQRLYTAKPQYLQGNQDAWDEMKKAFLYNYEIYNKLCIRLYYLNQHFNECYRRFFNVYYFDDTEDEYEAKLKIEQCIPNALSEEDFIKLNDHFNKYWAPDYTIWEVIKFNYRKLKHHLKGIKIYFFGRGKQKTKYKTKGKKK